MLDKITLRSEKDGVFALTDQIQNMVAKSGVKDGLCVVYTTHTTAALAATSRWDTLGHEDIQLEMRRLIPTRVDFKHQHDTPEDAAGHIKAAIVGSSVTFIIHKGELLLGHSKGIYFFEFDGPRNRECFVKIIQGGGDRNEEQSHSSARIDTSNT